MILCITEKPSVGRDIARILGANIQRPGYYEGNGYCVTWTFGHLCELKEPADYTPHWKSWGLSCLPMIPDKFGIKLKDDRGRRTDTTLGNAESRLRETCEASLGKLAYR